ncbi:MAG: helicase SNF2 [Alphaproteobacteria bacterium]|jgi:superfamily II DNA or RNA helicase|nr:helicase SNF2 [Alphaproteobacteria bacterium]
MSKQLSEAVTPPLTVRELASRFPGQYAERGRNYAREGRASVIAVKNDDKRGLTIYGRVKGSNRRQYSQDVTLRTDSAGQVSIGGSCTCPVRKKCKHMAAVLYTWLETKTGPTAAGSPPPSRARREPTVPEKSGNDLSPRWQRLVDQAAPAEPGLSPQWQKLLEEMAAAARETDYEPTVRRRLLYILDVVDLKQGARAVLAPMAVTLNTDDSWRDDAKPYSPDLIRSQRPKFITPADIEILTTIDHGQGIRRWSGSGSRGGYVLETVPGVLLEALLTRILSTGRAYWQDYRNRKPLASAPPRPATPTWIQKTDGSQVFTLAPDAAGKEEAEPAPRALPAAAAGKAPTILPVDPPYYIDPEAGLCGRLTTDLPSTLAARLLAAPPINAGEIAAFRREAEPRLGKALAVWPKAAAEEKVRKLKPVPVLRLFAARRDFAAFPSFENAFGRVFRSGHHAPCGAGGLWFDYGGQDIAPDDDRAELRWFEDDTLVRVPRKKDHEQSSLSMLSGYGLIPYQLSAEDAGRTGSRTGFFFLDPEGGDDTAGWIEFLYGDVPTLKAEGWRVEIAPDFPYSVQEPDGAWNLEIDSPSGIDWFGLSLGVEVDGERIDLLPVVRAVLSSGFLMDPENAPADDEMIFLPLEGGRHLALPATRVLPIARALRGLFDSPGASGKGKWPAARLGDLQPLEEAAAAGSLQIQGGEALRGLARTLAQIDGAEAAALPAGFRGDLRDYQKRGLAWLQALGQHGLGGILADDMGLGKTVQALAHLLAEKEAGRLDRPCLLIAPTSVVGNWMMEAERFTPDLRVVPIHGKDRGPQHAAAETADLVVTSYALLRQDHRLFAGRAYHAILCDEAQALKNPKSQAAVILRAMEARQVVCLTGTPMENHLDELWSLLSLAVPGIFGDRTAFRRDFRTPIEKHGDADRRSLLGRRIRPFLLRRRKDQVATELPPRTEMVETVTLTGAQRDLYETVRLTMDRRVREAIETRGLARSRITVLDALLKLRQVCCDPRLVKLDRARGVTATAKLTRLMAMLGDLAEEGRKVLVFSQFTSMLDLIGDELQDSRIPYLRLDGSTQDRDPLVRRFQAGEVPVFLLSLKAGGTGLNLTAADTVVHYDPWWNPAVEAQASDRAHRIGQTQPVFVHHLIAEGTVEARIRDLQARKRSLTSLIEDAGGETGPALEEADIDLLFAPIGA